MRITKKVLLVLLCFTILTGLLDSLYLAYMHALQIVPPCEVGSVFDCGQVLFSDYASIGGIPLAYLGVAHYMCTLIIAGAYMRLRTSLLLRLLGVFVLIGVVVSAYLAYLQVVVLSSLCLYCLVSAGVSFVISVLYVLYIYRLHNETI